MPPAPSGIELPVIEQLLFDPSCPSATYILSRASFDPYLKLNSIHSSRSQGNFYKNKAGRRGGLQDLMDSDTKLPPPENSQQEVVFEDYLFYAVLQRQEEEPIRVGRQISSQGSNASDDTEKRTWFSQIIAPTEKGDAHTQFPPMTVDEAERANASRALRLASWATVFYLITTDILGPFNAPYAISQVGWVPGVILYFVSSYTSLC